ncbi:unnamed protein product [Leuciscus chuanchicus]
MDNPSDMKVSYEISWGLRAVVPRRISSRGPTAEVYQSSVSISSPQDKAALGTRERQAQQTETWQPPATPPSIWLSRVHLLPLDIGFWSEAVEIGHQPSRRLNSRALKSPDITASYRRCLANNLSSALTHPLQNTAESAWANLSSAIQKAASDTIGFTSKRHQDWFDDSSLDILNLLEEKHKALSAHLSNPQSPSLRSNWNNIRAEHTLDVVCAVYQACGLQVNIKKTEIIAQTTVPTLTPPEFYIHGTPVKVVQHFCYLGNRITVRPTQNCVASAQTPTRPATPTPILRFSTHMSRLRQDMWLPDWASQPPSMAPPTAAAASTF